MADDDVEARLSLDISDLTAKLGEAAGQWKEGFEQMGSAGERVIGSLGSITGMLSAFGEVAGVGVAVEAVNKLWESLEHAAEGATHLVNSARQFGASTDEMQGLQLVAAQTGVPFGMLERAVRMLDQKMQQARENGGKLARHLEQVGVSAKDLADKSFAATDAMAAMGAAGISSTDAMTLLGSRIGGTVFPAFKALAGGMDEVAAAAVRNGALTAEQVEQLHEFHITAATAGLKMQWFAESVLSAAAPAMTQFYEVLTQVWKEALKPLVDNLVTFVTGVYHLGASVLQALPIVTSLKGAWWLLLTTLKAVETAFLAIELAVTYVVDVIIGWVTEAVEFVAKLAAALTALAHRDFKGAAEIGKAAFTELGDHFNKIMDGWVDHAKKVGTAMHDIWKPPEETTEIVVTAKRLPRGDAKINNDFEKNRKTLEEALKALEAYDANYEKGSIERIEIAQSEAAIIEQLNGRGSAAAIKAQQKINQAAQQYADAQAKALGDYAKRSEERELARIEREKLMLEEAYKDKTISARQYYDGQIELSAQEEAVQAHYYEQLIKYDKDNEKKVQQHEDELTKIHNKGTTARLKITEKAAEQEQTDWEKIFQPISAGFGNMLDGLLKHTMTFRQGMVKIFDDILKQFVDKMVTKPLNDFLAGQAQQRLATLFTAHTQAATQAVSSAQTVATKGTEAEAVVGANAAEAASGAAASVAAIPWVGWAMAAGVFAATLALVLGAKSSIKSAAGGWVVDSDQLAAVHKDEMVLPAHISEGIQGMVAAGSAGAGGGGDVHLHTHVHAMDAKGVEKFFKDKGPALMKSLHGQWRQFATPVQRKR